MLQVYNRSTIRQVAPEFQPAWSETSTKKLKSASDDELKWFSADNRRLYLFKTYVQKLQKHADVLAHANFYIEVEDFSGRSFSKSFADFVSFKFDSTVGQTVEVRGT